MTTPTSPMTTVEFAATGLRPQDYPELYSEVRKGLVHRIETVRSWDDPYAVRIHIRYTDGTDRMVPTRDIPSPRQTKGETMATQASFLMFATEIPNEQKLWNFIKDTDFKDYTNGQGRYLIWILGLLSTDVKAFSKFVREIPELTMKSLTDEIYQKNSEFNIDPTSFDFIAHMPKCVRPEHTPEAPFFFFKNWCYTCGISFTDKIKDYDLFKEETTLFHTYQEMDQDDNFMTPFNIATMSLEELLKYINKLMKKKKIIFTEEPTGATEYGAHTVEDIALEVRDSYLFDYCTREDKNEVPKEVSFKVGGIFYEA